MSNGVLIIEKGKCAYCKQIIDEEEASVIVIIGRCPSCEYQDTSGDLGYYLCDECQFYDLFEDQDLQDLGLQKDPNKAQSISRMKTVFFAELSRRKQ